MISFSDANTQCWVWPYDGNHLYMKKDDKLRFRVLAETFTDIPPVQKETLLARKAALESGDTMALPSTNMKSPFVLTVLYAPITSSSKFIGIHS